MWEISEIKEQGKLAFRSNYWPCVLVAFLMSIFTGGCSAMSNSRWQQQADVNISGNMDPHQAAAVAAAVFAVMGVFLLIGLLIKIFIANPIEVGGTAFFKCNVEETPAPFGIMGVGFRNYWHSFVTLFLRDLYLFLWTMLFIIPGIIKAYSYCMVPFILAENPDMPANEVITRSREMMNGNKWQAFLMDLSFIGWILLGILTLGLVLVFWTGPYMHSSHAALYLKLKESFIPSHF